MRVFVAGASGAIGRRLVPQLVAAAHDVTGTARSEQKAAAIRAAGARAAICDALDAVALRDAVAEAAPEVLVHELTALPDRFNPRNSRIYKATNRVRSEGTSNLVDAARAAGARRIVCQSVAFAYAPGARLDVKDEDAPLFLDAPAPFGEGVRVIEEMERRVLEAGDLEGLVLRYGWFYGPGTHFGDDGATAQDVRRRRFPVVGKGTGLFSFIHVDDAAAATVAGVERGAPGVYNIVDDEPAPMRDWLPAYAEAIGAKRPLRLPVWLVRLAAGRMATVVNVQPGAANTKAKRQLGWEPRWRSWREGFREAPR
ncbi:MAG TPA: NAD(P)-dependent oxidoreductase [Solirubrobacteraceae bacterium]|nr:NAD(P)-dependent oxidoreductase [Solirubrobacteraceae bacterium]